MATDQQVLELRRMVDEVEPSTMYPSNDDLKTLIDASPNIESAAMAIWNEKAAHYSKIVDVREGSSARSLGDLYKNALEMSSHFGTLSGIVITTSRRAGTRAIVRD